MATNLTERKNYLLKAQLESLCPNELVENLGVQISDRLSWTANAKKRTGKALDALFHLKRQVSKTTLSTKKRIMFATQYRMLTTALLWKPSKGDLTIIDNVQRKAVSLIFAESK